MKAAFLTKPQGIEFKEIPAPEPKAGEVRIELTKVGICGSDVHLYMGHRLLGKPTVIGHEGIGTIDKIGSNVSNRRIGERVAVEPNIPCQQCRFCKTGRGNICENKRVVGLLENGCFAEYICLPASHAWPIPDGVSDENAVCIEPMAVGVHALTVTAAKPGDAIAIIGLGAIGLLLNHLALKLGYKVLVTEINETKLAQAVSDGAQSANGTQEQIAKIWNEGNVVAVFECAGTAFTASLATASAPRGSEIILLGLSEKEATFTPLRMAREGISMLPSIIYKHPEDFQKTIDLIEKKVINPGKIISGYFPLNDIQNALEKAAQGNEAKLIVWID